MSVCREVQVQASPEEVWEALATEEGRERWLQEPEREIQVELAEPPRRLVWWWASADQPATRVEFLIVACPQAPASTRVVVIESAPTLPIAMLVASFRLVPA